MPGQLIRGPESFPVQITLLRDNNHWINCTKELKTTPPSLSHITSEFIQASDILTS